MNIKALALSTLLLLTGCDTHEFRNPPVDVYPTYYQAIEAAMILTEEHASYTYYHIAFTGSMKPFLKGGEWVVVDKAFPFEQLQVDDIINYIAVWHHNPAEPEETTTHRVNLIYEDSLVVSGDNSPYYEKGQWRVTRENYRGKIVRVITTK